MKYYKVPNCYDQKMLYNSKRKPNGYFLIGNELLTESECKKINAPIAFLQPVLLKKTDCYRLFGARFEK